MFSTVNILHELEVQENKIQNDLLASTQGILHSLEVKDAKIRTRLSTSAPTNDIILPSELIENEKLFSVSAIKKICLRYRLRFLDAKYFKTELPQEAIYKIRLLEEKYSISLSGFKIIAPDKMFNLEDRENDPILLADAGNGQYVFIHQWGGEFNWFRRITSIPLRNLENVLGTVFLAAFLTSVFYSMYVFTQDPSYVSVLFVVFCTFAFFIGYGCITVFSMFAFKIHPTEMIWKSRFID